jgi:hypothetical protein
MQAGQNISKLTLQCLRGPWCRSTRPGLHQEAPDDDDSDELAPLA